MRFFRYVAFALTLLGTTPAFASPFSFLIGDKDGFGLGIPVGSNATWTGWPGPLVDQRSAPEAAATNGRQLTDVYSALYYYGVGSGCSPADDPGCSPNGTTGYVSFPFIGTLNSGAITMRMADFECTLYQAMTVDINGVPVNFCFDDGFQVTKIRTFTLTPQMLLAANLAGEVRMNFDHRADYNEAGVFVGSFDYIAFDYFELNGDIDGRVVDPSVPEPSTWLLLGTGLTVLAARAVRRRVRPIAARR